MIWKVECDQIADSPPKIHPTVFAPQVTVDKPYNLPASHQVPVQLHDPMDGVQGGCQIPSSQRLRQSRDMIKLSNFLVNLEKLDSNSSTFPAKYFKEKSLRLDLL